MTDLSDLAAHCIRCGFCLEACPTYTETGLETESPRGRIYLVRSALEGSIGWGEEEVGKHLDLCLGCRACETACPSGVEYGRILELAREEIERRRPSRAEKWLLSGITRPRLLKLQLALGRLLPGKGLPRVLSRLLTRERPEVERPRAQRPSAWPPPAEASLPPVKGEVYLLEGCAMSVLFPRVHEATRRLLRRLGFAVRESGAGCCGALHAHQGLSGKASRMAARLAAAMPGDARLIVNSAGCGSFLKQHAPAALRERVEDVSEVLSREGLAGLLGESKGVRARATYHDACHLAHGQGIREAPRSLLRAIPGLELVELQEADTCCGSAGVYNVLQPGMARRLLERKWRNVEATGASIVAMGNPGCHAWIEQAAREKGSDVLVLHTAELLEASFSGLPE